MDATGSVAVKDQAPATPVEVPHRSIAERFTDWRRHYLPLPDEVVTEYLGDEEYVIHTDHPSFRAFLIKNMVQVLIATALLPIVFAFVRMDLEWWWILLIVLGLDLVLLVLAVRRLSDRYTSYVITNLRLIRVSGIIGRKLASIPWTRMTGLGFRQKPIGRLMGFATIFIESANEESGLREFSDINDPSTFHQMILDMVSSKAGPRPAEPTKGVRKTLRQRRREAREAQRKQNEAAIADAATGTEEPAAEEPATPAKVTDTAGPAEAMSTTDGLGKPKAPPKKPAAPVTPPTGTPVVGKVPKAKPAAKAPPNEPRPAKPTPEDRPAAKSAPKEAPAAKRTPDDRPVAKPPSPEARPAAKAPPEDRPAGSPQPRPTTGPGGDAQAQRPARPRQQGPRPTGPPPDPPVTPSRQRLAGPRPNRPAGEPTGTPNRPGSWAWPGGPRQRTGRPVSDRPPSKPLSARLGRFVDRLKGLTRRPESSADDGTLIEKVSARDALAAVRRGRGRPARRPRFPSFGRSKPAVPPSSRQLPAASSKPSDES